MLIWRQKEHGGLQMKGCKDCQHTARHQDNSLQQKLPHIPQEESTLLIPLSQTSCLSNWRQYLSVIYTTWCMILCYSTPEN